MSALPGEKNIRPEGIHQLASPSQIDVAAAIRTAAFQNISGIRRQQLLATADVDLIQQAGREGELVAFTRQGKRLHCAQWQERQRIVLGCAKVIAAVERAHVLDQPLLQHARGRRSVRRRWARRRLPARQHLGRR